jgi:hypothetical protein
LIFYLCLCYRDQALNLFRFSWHGEGVPQLSYWRERIKKQRKQFAPEEKVAILRRHLLEKEPISKLCEEMGLQPPVFYPLAEGILRESGCGLRAEAA